MAYALSTAPTPKRLTAIAITIIAVRPLVSQRSRSSFCQRGLRMFHPRYQQPTIAYRQLHANIMRLLLVGGQWSNVGGRLARDRRALLLAAGERHRQFVGLLGDPHPPAQRQGARAAVAHRVRSAEI